MPIYDITNSIKNAEQVKDEASKVFPELKNHLEKAMDTNKINSSLNQLYDPFVAALDAYMISNPKAVEQWNQQAMIKKDRVVLNYTPYILNEMNTITRSLEEGDDAKKNNSDFEKYKNYLNYFGYTDIQRSIDPQSTGGQSMTPVTLMTNIVYKIQQSSVLFSKINAVQNARGEFKPIRLAKNPVAGVKPRNGDFPSGTADVKDNLFRDISLKAKAIGIYFDIGDDQLELSTMEIVNQVFNIYSLAVGTATDYYTVRGVGDTEPRGFLPGATPITAASTIWESIQKAKTRLFYNGWQNNVMGKTTVVISEPVYYQLMTEQLTNQAALTLIDNLFKSGEILVCNAMPYVDNGNGTFTHTIAVGRLDIISAVYTGGVKSREETRVSADRLLKSFQTGYDCAPVFEDAFVKFNFTF